MRLLRRVAEESAPHKESAPEPVEGRRERPEIPTSLAPRELEVLRHLSVGRTNGQIAKELHLSLSTVKRYLDTYHLQARCLRPHPGGGEGCRDGAAARAARVIPHPLSAATVCNTVWEQTVPSAPHR
jgi:DNA-binding CsgD family transcriptional regulator